MPALVATITYDAVNNKILVTGTTTAFFNDVYNADVAGGWGKILRQGLNQFLLSCFLQIGNGTIATVVSDSNKQVVFADGVKTANSQAFIYVYPNASATFGVLQDAVTKRTGDGCSFLDLTTVYYGYLIRPAASTTSLVYLYGCSFYSQTVESWWEAAEAYNIVCNGRSYPYFAVYTEGMTFDYNNIIVSGAGTNNAGYGIRCPRASAALNNLFINVPNTKVWFQSSTGIVKNVYFRGAGYTFRMENVNVDCYIINADDGGVAWNANWVNSTGHLFRQYEFDFAVTEAEGNPLQDAVVSLVDNGGVLAFSVATDAYGQIPTQTITRGYYQQDTASTLHDLSPHTLTVKKNGYQTYRQKFTLTEETKWAVKLSKTCPLMLDLGAPTLNLQAANPENPVVLRL